VKFTLSPENDLSLRFALVSDGHYGQERTEYIATHDEMIAWTNGEQKQEAFIFTFINGDLFHDDTTMHKKSLNSVIFFDGNYLFNLNISFYDRYNQHLS